MSKDVAWAAGLYEGEGCISVSRIKNRPPVIQLGVSMDEEWPVRRFSEIVGSNLGGPYGPFGMSTRQRWQARLYKRSEIARVLWMFKPYLGPRRREQIKRVIREARRERREFYGAQPPKLCAACECPHDEQTPGCKSCYMRHYHRQHSATR